MKKLIGLVVTFCLSYLFMPMSYAFESGRWNYGYGQGTNEYVAYINEQNQLYIACDAYGEQPLFIMLTVQGKEYDTRAGEPIDVLNYFDLIIDGQHIQSFNETNSRVGDDNFRYAWDKLRTAKSIIAVTADGKRLKLPAKNSFKVLPATTSKDFTCRTGFSL